MAVTRPREIDRFDAVSNDHKYRKTIVVYQHFIDAATYDADATMSGLKSFRTTDGFRCNCKSDDTFEVVNDPHNPGIIVHRVR